MLLDFPVDKNSAKQKFPAKIEQNKTGRPKKRKKTKEAEMSEDNKLISEAAIKVGLERD